MYFIHRPNTRQLGERASNRQPGIRAKKPGLVPLLTEKDCLYIARPDKERQMEISKTEAD